MANPHTSSLEDELSDFDPGEHEDSDRESLFSEALLSEQAPVDGYFQQRQHPQETYVRNSSVQAEADTKAREAAQDRAQAAAAAAAESAQASRSQAAFQHSSTPTSPVRSTHSTHTPVWHGPSAQHPDPTAPPPDYQTAISDHASNHSGNTGHYGTLPGPAQSATPQPRQDGRWPFGNIGNPFASPHFPFGSNMGPFFMPGPFGNDHPLVRNGLIGHQNDANNRAVPESMRDHSPPQRNGGTAEHQYRQSHENDIQRPATPDEETGLIDRRIASSRRDGERVPATYMSWDRPIRRYWKPDQKKRRRNCCAIIWRSFVKIVIFFAVLIAMAVLGRIVYSIIQKQQDSSKTPHDPPEIPEVDQPSKAPKIPFPSASDAQCNWGPLHVVGLSFPSINSFNFVEMMQRRQIGDPLRVLGDVHVKVGDDSQTDDILVWLYTRVSQGWTVGAINWDSDGGDLELSWPTLERISGAHNGGCLRFDVLVQIRPQLEVENFEISTAHLNFQADGGMFGKANSTDREATGVRIRNSTAVTTTSGSAQFDNWSSRETIVESSSGDVTGSFALLDLLAIHSQSGEVDVTLQLKEVDPQRPRPAELRVVTSSGEITVRTQVEGNVPKRDYQSRLESSSGQISGVYMLGSSASFQTSNGAMDLLVTPYDFDAKNLYTKSSSGSTDLVLTGPYTAQTRKSRGLPKDIDLDDPENPSWDDWTRDSFQQLQSSHHSSSGELRLLYSPYWMGIVRADTNSGSIRVSGKGVHRVYDTPNSRGTRYSRSQVYRKGVGDSLLVAKTSGGDVEIAFDVPYPWFWRRWG